MISCEHSVQAIRHLLSAVTNASLYGTEHPQVRRLLDMCAESLKQTFEQQGEVTLDVIENELLINGKPQAYSLHLTRCVTLLLSRGVRHIRFIKGVSTDELTTLLAGLTQVEREVRLVSTDHIKLGRIKVELGADGELGDSTLGAHKSGGFSFPELPEGDKDTFMEMYEAVSQRKKLKMSGIFNMVSGFVEAFRDGGKSLMLLSSLRETDEYTFTHSANVSILTIAQARALGIEGERLHEIGVAAMLHDIGKLFVPDEILKKTDKLTAGEFAIMRDHPERGARYLLDTAGVPRLAVLVAYEHHMRYNLSGYPAVPKNWKLNNCSHMTMIADFFDALRTRRSYREPMELSAIGAMMLDMIGTDFHPFFARNFLSVLSKVIDN